MNIEKYTQNAQSAIMDCQNIAISEGHQMLEGEHLHLALLMQKDGLIPKLLQYMKVDVTAVIGDLQEEIEKYPKVSGAADNMYSSRRLSKLLLDAEKIAEGSRTNMSAWSTCTWHSWKKGGRRAPRSSPDTA